MRAKNSKNVHGQVLALTKQIFLQKPIDRKAFISKFFMGNRTGPGQFATEWWTTWDSEIICDDLANAIKHSDSTLQNGDVESFSHKILEVLRELLVDATLFDFWKVFQRNVPTLFDAITTKDKRGFGEVVFQKCLEGCKNTIRNWLVIYPLARINAPTIKIEADGLLFISATDKVAWKAFESRYADTGFFDIQAGQWFMNNKPAPFLGAPVPSWVACELIGTAAGARQEASRRFRRLIAILFSILCEKHPTYLYKSGIETSRYSVQFAGGNGSPPSNQLAPIGQLLPPLLEDLSLDDKIIQEVRNWYFAVDAMGVDRKLRLQTASQFLHYAIISDDIERFLHFFIALDALFGERGKVETEILNGVGTIFANDTSWRTRCSQLFDLRSELVHGAHSLISDWPTLAEYRRQFHSIPLSDVATIAMKALRDFSLIKPVPTQRSHLHRLTQPIAKGLFRIAGRLNRL